MAVKSRKVNQSSVNFRIMQYIEETAQCKCECSAVQYWSDNCSAVMASAHHHLITCVQTSKDSPVQCRDVWSNAMQWPELDRTALMSCTVQDSWYIIVKHCKTVMHCYKVQMGWLLKSCMWGHTDYMQGTY